jgi:hypothetical protein
MLVCWKLLLGTPAREEPSSPEASFPAPERALGGQRKAPDDSGPGTKSKASNATG